MSASDNRRETSESRSPAASPYRCLCCYCHRARKCRHRVNEDPNETLKEKGAVGVRCAVASAPRPIRRNTEESESATRVFKELVDSKRSAKEPQRSRFMKGLTGRLEAGVYYPFGISRSSKSETA